MNDFSSKSLIQLSFDQEEMEKRKSSLAVVHTLRHIGFLLPDPNLTSNVENHMECATLYTKKALL